jgi:tetratricopeptide (TPR) repeat protein
MTPSKNQAIQTALIGNWQNATAINKALIHSNPNDIEALNRLAFALTVLGKLKNAISIYKKVLKLDSLNPIALKNIKRLTEISSQRKIKNLALTTVNYAFLEETGKTKIVELVNVAQPRIIARLTVGQSLVISIKRLKIFIKDQALQYIGMLPDDISKRLIKFIKGGNAYEAYVKSVNNHDVIIFIREIKRVYKFNDQPSFPYATEKSLDFEKKTEKSFQKENKEDKKQEKKTKNKKTIKN